MTVTELAIVPLAQPITKDNPALPESLIQKLKTAKISLESVSGHAFYLFQQIEDPSIVYIVGQWDSVEAYNKYWSTAENQNSLALLTDDLDTSEDRKVTFWHLDTNIFALDTSSGEKSVFTAPAISCNRHFVPIEKKQAFGNKFQEVKGYLEDYTKPFKLVGGWRIEKEAIEERDKEEWILFSGFETVDHHMSFVQTGDFPKYRAIVEFVEGFELKHLRAIDG